MASYREEFVAELLRRRPDVALYCGSAHFDPTVTLSSAIALKSKPLKNRFFCRRRLLWQSGAVRAGIRPSCAVLEFNPRIISVWVLLAVRGLLRKRSILWGHAWPRKGSQSRTAVIRQGMARLADGVLVYTPRDREELARAVRCPVYVAPNAVCSRKSVTLVPGSATDVLQIGRLVSGKRPLLTVEAWAKVCDDMPDSQLVFVGTGPLAQEVLQYAQSLDISERIQMRGHISDPKVLAVIFANSLCSVSAGYAGLSITQSFSQGVPALIADNEPHSPEIAIATEGNSKYFRAGDPSDLARGIIEFWSARQVWLDRRGEISGETLRDYSVETMADGFLTAAHP